jgi:hypothetical protein
MTETIEYPGRCSTFYRANIFRYRNPGRNHHQQMNMIRLHIQLDHLAPKLLGKHVNTVSYRLSYLTR